MKRVKKSSSPRYITIRIQYYPLSKGFLWFPLALLIFFLYGNLLISIRQVIKDTTVLHDKKIVNKTIKSALPLMEFNNFYKNENQVITHGPRYKKQVALTFDADMTPGMKARLDSGEVQSYVDRPLLDVLNSTQTKATLFLTGMWMEIYPDMTRELAADPLFELGSHSYSHPSFFGDCYGLEQISDSQKQIEIQKTQTILKDIAGVDGQLFRFPGGCHSPKEVALVAQNGLKTVDWDTAGVDGFNDDAQSIEENVLKRVNNGSIIVLHMNGFPNEPKTAEAVQVIIDKLKAKGFEFVKVSDLLSLPQKWYNLNTI